MPLTRKCSVNVTLLSSTARTVMAKSSVPLTFAVERYVTEKVSGVFLPVVLLAVGLTDTPVPRLLLPFFVIEMILNCLARPPRYMHILVLTTTDDDPDGTTTYPVSSQETPSMGLSRYASHVAAPSLTAVI